jgi:hypothetical protein
VIWTPRFIVSFALALVLSLSLTSILVEIWNNTGHGYSANHVRLVYTAATLACWTVILVYARSPWVKVGAIFCVAWTFLKAGEAIFYILGFEERSIIFLHLNAATSSALLGAYICLAITRTPLTRWDGWLFRLAPLLVIGITATIYMWRPEHVLNWFTLERALNSALLCLSLVIWWLRPSCWKVQLGPAFMLGTIPLIQFVLNATYDTTSPTMQYFFSLIMLLAMLFGGLRILQSEHVHTEMNRDKTTSHGKLHSKWGRWTTESDPR